MSEDDELATLLARGIAAAQEGNRELARRLLTQVVEQDERNAKAWFWLSGVVDDLSNREVCLRHVLELEPDNLGAHRALEALQRQRVDELLKAAVTAAERGQRDHARKLFTRVVQLDERRVEAWIWLAELVPDLDDREICLENALALDPQNEAVRKDLERVRRLRVEIAEARAAATPSFIPVARGAEEPEPILMPVAREPFTDPYGCPYCGIPTAPEDRKCPGCGGNLWLLYPRREERSPWLWVAMAVQACIAIWSLAGLAALIIYVAYRVGADRAYRLIPAYLGLPTDMPRQLLDAALELVPRPVFVAGLASVVLSLVVLVGLYLRAWPFFYLFLGNALLSTVLTIGTTMQLKGPALPPGISGVLLALALVWLALQLQDDFFKERRRILLQPEPEAAGGQDFWLHGRRFARAGMWALAALHLRKALAWLPDNAELHLDLALACIQLRRYQDAADALVAARRLQPGSRRILEVSELLEQAMAADTRR